MPSIETARLRLRTFRLSDTDDFYRIWTDPEVIKFFPPWPLTREKVARSMARSLERWRERNFGLWALELKENGNLIGSAGLQHLDNTTEVEVAYILDTPYWGKGFATEAAKAALRYGFTEVGIERIVAITDPQNVSSRHVMEKLGMKYEKVTHFYGVDNVYYAVSREAYQPDEDPYLSRRA
ncbi:MAG: GNAT family N-acetyltransferase [Pyrinomonadaceae bacterium]|nr:GNAT family N-acetyltransferase [Pyrinomonadaceae bacterium]